MQHVGVIVDGYSTGAELVRAFAERGVTCVHVQSQHAIPKVYQHTYVSQDYLNCFIFHAENLDHLVQQLAAYKPSFVMAGAECGIEVADLLAEKLELPGNGTKLSLARRNKYVMWETVRAQGISVIPSYRANSLEDALQWTSEQNIWPLVIKPLQSAGGEGVKICNSLVEVEQACLAVLDKKIDMLGFENQSVLLQQYIEGEEFVVNTVSYNGQHKLCELWQYTRYFRSGGLQIYDTASMIDYDEELHRDIIDYAFNIIDALGIKYGPAHVEIIKNKKSCFLVELGARLMGANLPFELLHRSVSTPQFLLTVQAYVDQEAFYHLCGLEYELIQPLMAVFMVSDCSGKIISLNDLERIKSLPSFYGMKLAVKPGDELHYTVDYQTSPGMIYLSHPDVEIINADKEKIRKIEKHLFDIAKKLSVEIAV